MFALCPQFIVIEFCVFMYVRERLDVFEEELDSYIASMNQTGTLAPVLLQVKELMNVSKGKPILARSCCLTAGGSPLPQNRQLEVQGSFTRMEATAMLICYNFLFPLLTGLKILIPKERIV